MVPVHPAARAALIASAAKAAAPRAEFALPPRSRVPAMTGAACDVLIVAASMFSPRTSTVFREISVCPNAAPRFSCPVDSPLHRVYVHERELIRAGQQRRQAGHLRQQLPGPAAAGRPHRKCAEVLSCQNVGSRRKQTAAGITRMTRRIICLGASSALLVDGPAPTP